MKLFMFSFASFFLLFITFIFLLVELTSNGRDSQSIQQLWGLNEETGKDDDDDYEDEEDDDDDNVAANSKFRSERAEKNQRIKGMRAGTGIFTHLLFLLYFSSFFSIFIFFSVFSLFLLIFLYFSLFFFIFLYFFTSIFYYLFHFLVIIFLILIKFFFKSLSRII